MGALKETVVPLALTGPAIAVHPEAALFESKKARYTFPVSVPLGNVNLKAGIDQKVAVSEELSVTYANGDTSAPKFCAEGGGTPVGGAG